MAQAPNSVSPRGGPLEGRDTVFTGLLKAQTVLYKTQKKELPPNSIVVPPSDSEIKLVSNAAAKYCRLGLLSWNDAKFDGSKYDIPHPLNKKNIGEYCESDHAALCMCAELQKMNFQSHRTCVVYQLIIASLKHIFSCELEYNLPPEKKPTDLWPRHGVELHKSLSVELQRETQKKNGDKADKTGLIPFVLKFTNPYTSHEDASKLLGDRKCLCLLYNSVEESIIFVEIFRLRGTKACQKFAGGRVLVNASIHKSNFRKLFQSKVDMNVDLYFMPASVRNIIQTMYKTLAKARLHK